MAAVLALPWSGRVGAGLAAESAAVTSTAQRMRHLQVNIPLLRLLLGDWAPQLPLHGGPGWLGRRGHWGGLRRAVGCCKLRRRKAESGQGAEQPHATRPLPFVPLWQPPPTAPRTPCWDVLATASDTLCVPSPSGETFRATPTPCSLQQPRWADLGFSEKITTKKPNVLMC